MYEQVPMVEIDGMNLVETRAILRYLAAKYDLYGRNLQEQAWIDMYVEGLKDLSDMIMFFPLSLPGEKKMNLEYILKEPLQDSSLSMRSWPAPKIRSQVSKLLDFLPNHPDFKLSAGYAPESSTFFSTVMQALRDHGQDFLVGDQLSWADTQLLEVILMAEECKPSVLAGFPLLQEFKARISYIPTIRKFLQPGSQRKPPLDEGSIETVKNIFRFERGMLSKTWAL
ncbi:hypothetical protein GH733_000450 [Mirounga leonina]|nr:hypothetical protein GH733_000450 [Mirounga leonina]